jgi:hypothetical protein
MSVLPDPTPDLCTAVYRELHAIAASLVVAGLHDADDRWAEPWIFKWEPRESVNGTGLASVVISVPRPWTAPNRHNTGEFPLIQIEVYTDQTRTDTDAPYFRDAQAKAYDVWRLVDKVLHRPGGGEVQWGNADGTIRVVSSYRAADPEIAAVPGTDGNWRLMALYDVELG